MGLKDLLGTKHIGTVAVALSTLDSSVGGVTESLDDIGRAIVEALDAMTERLDAKITGLAKTVNDVGSRLETVRVGLERQTQTQGLLASELKRIRQILEPQVEGSKTSFRAGYDQPGQDASWIGETDEVQNALRELLERGFGRPLTEDEEIDRGLFKPKPAEGPYHDGFGRQEEGLEKGQLGDRVSPGEGGQGPGDREAQAYSGEEGPLPAGGNG